MNNESFEKYLPKHVDTFKEFVKRKEYLNKFKKPIVSAFECEYSEMQPKIVWKIETFVQSSLYRVIELIEIIEMCWDKKKFSGCFICARNIVENTAQLFYINEKIRKFSTKNDINSINKIIVESLFATRINDKMPQAISILTQIDKTDKKFNGFRGIYDLLCEVSHPNYLGLLGLYGSRDEEKLAFNFTADNKERGNILHRVFLSIDHSLLIYESIINEVENLYLDVAKLCEDYKPI